MQDVGDAWDYAVIHVGNIIVAMKNPQKFFNDLQGPDVGFMMKGTGKLMYHLGADFFWDDDGTLCLG